MATEALEDRLLLSGNSFLDLSSLDSLLGNDGTNGAAWYGTVAGQGVGGSVAILGDINNDGYDDIAIGAPNADVAGKVDCGEVYVLFGSAAGINPYLKLADLNGSQGFKLTGAQAGDALGFAVAAAGDVNGDGFDDFLVGSPGADVTTNDNAGRAYVIYGASSFGSSINVAQLGGVHGFTIQGNAGDNLGRALSAAGDMNKDGKADVAVSAAGTTGRVLVVFGKTSMPSLITTADMNGSKGFTIEGVSASDQFGTVIASAGDMNGDGYSDLAVGAYMSVANGKTQAGRTYVIFGKGTFTPQFKAANITGTNGFAINGHAAGNQLGRALAGGGDVNGDGLSDLIVGAPLASAGTANSGQVFVVHGRTTSFPAYLNKGDLTGTNGVVVNGTSGSYTGFAVGMGDVNGDGRDDLILGTIDGAVVLRGKPSYGAAEITWDELSTNDRNTIIGSVYALGSGGDVNGDGRDDIVIGNPSGQAAAGPIGGGAWLALGAEFNAVPQTAAVVELPGAGTYGLYRSGDFLIVQKQTGQVLLKRHIASVSMLRIAGTDAAETLILDFSGGNPIPAGNAEIDLGSQPVSGSDQLQLTGSVFSNVTYNQFSSGSGNVRLLQEGKLSQIAFTGVETIKDTLVANTRAFQYGSDADKIVLGDNGVAGDGISRIARTGWKQTIDFLNPVASLHVGGGAGSDTIDLNAIDSTTTLTNTNGMRVNGQGLLAFKTPQGIVYARSAALRIDDEGRIVSPEGWRLQGYAVNAQFVLQTSTMVDVKIPYDELQAFASANQASWGTVQDITVLADGRIIAAFTSGKNLVLGQVVVARFTNAGALQTSADGWTYTATVQSGQPIYGAPGASGAGQIVYKSLTLGTQLLASGNAGNDVVDAADAGRSTILNGNVGNDSLVGSAQGDRIYGGAGDDLLEGRAGNDTLFGHGGNDRIHGGLGEDLLRGDSGSDTLRGDEGADTVEGGAGHDLVDGGAGADTLLGGAGNDTLLGGDGRDTIFGGDGHDGIDGGDDNDWVSGDSGNDTAFGAQGNDTLLGGDGKDMLFGEEGDDALNGQGTPNDTLAGGAGNDRYTNGSQLDLIDATFMISVNWRAL